MSTVILEPADIFLTRGHGLISRAIRFFTRQIGESRTQVNHVGVVVRAGGLREAIVVEALSSVRRHPLWKSYGPPNRDGVAVYRPVNLSAQEIVTVVSGAQAYVGRKYGWHMLLAHLADWLLQGAYVFRRLAGMDNYPICSWVVAHAYLKTGIEFGVAAGEASPDDIWDFVRRHPESYTQIRPLLPLGQG